MQAICNNLKGGSLIQTGKTFNQALHLTVPKIAFFSENMLLALKNV